MYIQQIPGRMGSTAFNCKPVCYSGSLAALKVDNLSLNAGIFTVELKEIIVSANIGRIVSKQGES